ncbi:hypothetical protein JCM9279_001835 [Rhodotorula babjevae]
MTAISTRSTASAPASADRPKRERQTRLQEHLRAVKPGSRSSSPGRAKPAASASASSASKTVPKAMASFGSASAVGTDDDDEATPSTLASTASGRPMRKAAAKVVMQEPADSASGDEDVEQVKPARAASSVSRTPTKRRSPVDDDTEDLAPAVKPAGRGSTGRKAPAQRTERSSSSPSPSKKRAREPSSLEFGRLNEAEVQGRLAHEKAELMARLAPLGINPQDHVLDKALRAMSKSNTQFTVESFISTLASLDANVSPRTAQSQRPALSVAVPPPSQAKHVSFSTLESPSSLASPSFRIPTPPQAAVAPVAVPGLFYSSPAPPHAAPPARAPLSAVRPGQLASGSLSRSFSAPVVPTLGNPQQAPPLAGPAPSGSLFGSSVAGMGRVATRRGAFGALGQDLKQPQQSASAAHKRATPGSAAPPAHAPAATAALSGRSSSSLLPAFAFGAHAASAGETPARTAALSTSASTSRLSKLQSWLAQGDDDGTSEDEDDAKKPGAPAAGAEAMFKAAAATSKVAAAVPAPPLQLIDAPPSDDERQSAGRPRVGGKSVQGLRQRRDSRDQQAQPHTVQAQPQQRVVGDMEGMTTRRRASVKGKGRAVAECTCGASAEGEADAVSCAECDVAFHLDCLNAVSASQLASPWTCSRCVVAAAADGEEAGEEGAQAATPPKLADKRVRIGTTSTPHLYQEPTLVASTPVAPPRGNSFSHMADMALAPSPTASPVRRFVPTSPVPSAGRLPIPVTPHFGETAVQRAPGDYSPTSPQNYRSRAGRTRMVSGGAFLSGEWLNSSWDSPAAQADAEPPRDARATTPVQSGGLASLIDGDAADPWQLPAWSDVTMTPSRALTSSATPGLSSSASSSVWDTPFGHASPHAHLRRANSSYHAPTLGSESSRTPSHDFLAALERDPAEHSAPAAGHTFGQRLFYGAHEQQHEQAPNDAQAHGLSASSSSPQRSASPLNPRRVPSYGYAAPSHQLHHQHHLGQQQQHQLYKQPSLGDGLANPWSNGGALAHERTALSASMKPSFSAPGVQRFSQQHDHFHGGHEGVEQQMLDDLLV